jgi:Winged helix-turn helix
MRPVSVFAGGSGSEIERLRAGLRGPWRQAARAVMVLLSLHELPAAQIAVLPECHPGTVRRWIGRFNSEGLAGLADRPRCGRPALGGRRLAGRIAALPGRPGPRTLPRIRRYLGWPQISMRTLYRRVRLVAVWRRPKLVMRVRFPSPAPGIYPRVGGATAPSVEIELVALDVLHHHARLVVVIGKQESHAHRAERDQPGAFGLERG